MKKYGAAVFSLLVIVLAGSAGFASDDLKIVKDKEGTTWSVGSDESRERAREEEERDRDRAWDMLKNQSIIIDKRTTK
ncbi:MAG: hypothetical protein A4E60_03048 [Syntrophorhabdus sp. PtaB.Bin047]|jgi:hypothetical protein|nr:MAG: hypothetical protein A4E60_03048 [Syntrophorhabdus sp. PtaB.Bin047]